MIKIEAKNGKKFIKKTIEVEYIDCIYIYEKHSYM